MSPQAGHKAVIVLGTLCLVLGAFTVRTLLRDTAPARDGAAPAAAPPGSATAAQDAVDRAAVVAQMVAASQGINDVHPDGDVGRVLQPGLQGRDERGHPIHSNRFGLRERDFALPKPAGTVRVALLGDSFIYGYGVAAEERLGVPLERALVERSGLASAPAIEVLHLGVLSWDIRAEAAFLRRQLALLQPDLVVHHIVPNDLDDLVGVRGFGSLAKHSSRHPERGDVQVSLVYGRWTFDSAARGLLPWGLDAESRERLAACGDEIEQLAAAVTATGARYLLLINWQAYQAVAGQAFAARLPPEQVAWLSWDFYKDLRWRISTADEHWSPVGHEQVAQFLYGQIRQRDLLPQLSLQAWPEAEAQSAAIDAAGLAESQRLDFLEKQRARQGIGPLIDLAAMTADMAGQVYGGVDKAGLVAPYASVLLQRGEARNLRLQGRCLPRPELDGATVRVLADDVEVGQLKLAAGAQLDLRAPLPPAVLARPYFAVRLIASDHVLAGEDLRQCVVFQLERLAAEP
ncbi:MAG: hypothetical protein ACT4PU_09920 [Planctomycetota bacterium]